MGQEHYAYAVSTIRIKENALFSADNMEQLLSAPNYEAVRQQLVERGWLSSDTSADDDTFLKKQMVSTWELIREVAPDPTVYYALVLKNDFHNLKAAVKCSFNDTSPEPYFMKPCVEDAAAIADAVMNHRFDDLPESMREAARKAHDVFVRTQDGQYADVYIDTAALTSIRRAGRESGNPLMDAITELSCAASNIKTALRAMQTRKDAYFLESALSVCDTLDKPQLASAALKGNEALMAYLMSTVYADAAKSLTVSQSAFEKWFDDLMMERILATKYTFFGPEPLIAYYIAREAEVKNIRILLSGKRNGVEDSIIRERMRRLYV